MSLDLCQVKVNGNVKDDCDNPAVAGFKSLGIGIHRNDAILTRDAGNKRKITGITLKEGATPFAIYNPDIIPYAGSKNSVDYGNARPTFKKSVIFGIPNVGADASRDIIEPILKNRDGFILILPRKNQVADGGFVIVGSECGAVGTAGEQDYTDTKKNGMIEVTLTEEGANYAEVTLSGATFDAAQATFDGLLALIS